MKKTILLTIIVFVLTFGLAFVENSSAQSKETNASITHHNGITFFDLGPTPACGGAEETTAGGATIHPFNGITFFDLGLSGPGGRVSCTGKSNVSTTSIWPYNGITIF